MAEEHGESSKEFHIIRRSGFHEEERVETRRVVGSSGLGEMFKANGGGLGTVHVEVAEVSLLVM